VWSEFRERRLEGYRVARERGEVDEDIIPLLDLINSFEEFVTLSSCSGRIAVMDMPEFGRKREAKFLGKWHSCVEYEDVLNALEGGVGEVWLIMFPPIIHVACRDLRSAEKLMRCANDAGMRRCGIISLKRYVIEMTTLERMEVPVKFHGKRLVDDGSLRIMVDIANRKLVRSKEKLKRLYERLLREL